MGNRIKELRTEEGISGIKLAEMLNISPQYFYDLEKGDKRLNEDILINLARIFNTTTDYILGISNTRNPVESSGKIENPLAGLPKVARQEIEDFKEFVKQKYKDKK
jgi:transcriptional regulator with XRE-family HTH domain